MIVFDADVTISGTKITLYRKYRIEHLRKYGLDVASVSYFEKTCTQPDEKYQNRLADAYSKSSLWLSEFRKLTCHACI
jgi:hypothetical protein